LGAFSALHSRFFAFRLSKAWAFHRVEAQKELRSGRGATTPLRLLSKIYFSTTELFFISLCGLQKCYLVSCIKEKNVSSLDENSLAFVV